MFVILLSLGVISFGQVQEEKSRDILIKESLTNIHSDNIHVAAQAARYFGIFQVNEGVPAMLRVLQSRRFLSTSEHVMAKDKSGMNEWLFTSVKDDIVTALAKIKDKRAVPVLKKFLKKRPTDGGAFFTQNVAWALYQITGRSYKYKDRDGKVKLYQPTGEN
ncbi:MAG: hypothetical protein ACKVQW_07540 [Pyrinomonadaceae bacterium]